MTFLKILDGWKNIRFRIYPDLKLYFPLKAKFINICRKVRKYMTNLVMPINCEIRIGFTSSFLMFE